MKLFIWDFHGTLEKGNEFAVLEITNYILEKHGFKVRLSKKHCLSLYGKKWFEFFEFLLPDLPKSKHLSLQQDCFVFSNQHPEIIARNIKLVDHANDVLSSIRQKHDQILISNTQPVALKYFLESVGISHFFPQGKAFGINAHVKKSTKLEVIKKFVNLTDFEEIITIGDAPQDVELGLSIGAKTYLYTHPGLEFRDCNPHFKINDLREVLSLV